MSDGPELPALAPDEQTALRGAARDALRRWLASDDATLLRQIDRFGAAELEAAAALASRLAPEDDGGAVASLDRLARLIETVHAPMPRRRLFGVAPVPPIERRLAEAEPELTALLDRLARARDALARSGVGRQTQIARFVAADAALERAVRLAALLVVGLGAAARELASDQPARAGLLSGEATARAVERQRDLLVQLTVLRQARLSLDLLVKNQAALVRAIDRARHTSVAALRTAVAATQALTGAGRADARAAPPDPATARQDIADAVARMRDALAP